jgi:aldehyde:ferredoxin oxidoreductase
MSLLVKNLNRCDIMNWQEILKGKAKSLPKCTKTTKKTSSPRKNKKWTKCVPDDSTSSGYGRRHWGDPNAKVTGGSGDTKRKKNFKDRHSCDSCNLKEDGQKRYYSNQCLACRDWA